MDIKFILCTVFITFLTFSYGQSLETKQIEKIQGFGIDYQSNIQTDPNISSDLLNILESDRKRKKNKTFGIILGGMGLLTTAFGTSAFTSEQPNPYSIIIGGVITGIGLAEIGISISLFKSSKKRKIERDKIIEKYNPNWAVE